MTAGMSWREDSFELNVPKRSPASADAASTLGLDNSTHLTCNASAFSALS